MRLTTAPRNIPLLSLLIPVSLAALILAYLWALSTRPDVPENARISDPLRWGFPAWYGESESPYDKVFKGTEVVEEGKQVLFFIDLPYDSLQIPRALSTLSTLRQNPALNITIISPFLSHWDADLPPVENLEAARCSEMDWVWRIGGSSRGVGDACQGAVWIREAVGGLEMDKRADVLLLEEPQMLLADEINPSRVEDKTVKGWELGLISYVRPAVRQPPLLEPPAVFYPLKKVNSPQSITYFPSSTTPTREIPSIPWKRGWSTFSPSRGLPPPIRAGHDPFRAGSTYLKYWHKEEKRRAKAMRNSGICLFEGWQDGRVDARMVEAFLSGCVVATFPPQTDYDTLSSLILPLPKPPPSPHQTLPAQALTTLLSHTPIAQLRHLSLKSFISARHLFIPPSRLESIHQVVDRWEKGGRGYDFTHGFRWDCAGGVGAPWCGDGGDGA
ncbi:hypothetical protein L198_01212 [Cryptococcus wingfieldii CBS 7118]|uniref:Uncharacterized protein n=1 Tax=Cryptococcus wingfieldii CBS 7118 TaxID=1295528 RepID=A0A1E3K3K9_9TREE|nr:hypothetical protein L198_01212 [Cryptococcus wingfieldii CBS 7118]ODO07631.1 hypothetical protein L198_01212 [Cryptococcus wingfieldii CBS 7118]